MVDSMKKITLAHGNGGRLMHELIEVLRLRFSNNILDEMADAAELNIKKPRLAFSTDSYVIKPIFFPGGDIGELAVCGTVNDISMKGAKPLYISLSFIIEEGLELVVFEKIAESIKKAAKRSKVLVVTGDIKVVEKGAADKIYINTAGIGAIDYPKRIGVKPKPADAIIINGSVAEHGMAILNAREELGFKSAIKSDCKNINFQVQKALSVSDKITVLRDLTRGGLATALNEIASASGLGIEIDEKDIPIKPGTSKICDILGFDPLYVANEGKFICFADAKDVAKIKRALGKEASIIGRVVPSHKKEVVLHTKIGSSRILPMLETDQLPRIC